MPASYTPKTRDTAQKETTHSQSLESNVAAAHATVADLLAGKGRDVFGLRPEDTVARAVEILRDKHIGALMVHDGEGGVAGILSERDIVRRMADTPGQTLPQAVADLMTTKVEATTPDELLDKVLRRMTDGRFRHMPVLDNGALVGMITIGDVVQYRLNALELEALKLKQLIVG